MQATEERIFPPALVLQLVVPRRSLTRRQVLRAGALVAAAVGLRPSPALAARPAALFELPLDGLSTRASAAAAGGWRTSGVLDAPRRFDLVGLTWARGSSAEAQIRARRRGGRWTGWVTLHPAGDHGPDRGDAPDGTDPAFVGTADQFQLRLRGNPRRLRARFVRALPTARTARRLARRLSGGSRARAAAAQVSPPVIIPRSAWGAAAVPPRAAPVYGQVQLAFVHHTVTANDYDPEDSAAIVLGIARYHRNSNGWNDIGYNFLVDKYGQVFEGRAGGIEAAVMGAQAQGYNSVSTGIACLGNFSTIAQTPVAMDALARLIGWKLSVHAVPTQGEVTVTSAGGETNRYAAGTPVTFQRISGHRDGNNTSCPGTVLYGQLDALRSAAARFAGPLVGLSLNTVTRLRGLRPVNVSGYLRFPDGSAAAGAPVDIEFLPRAATGAAWGPLATAVCDANGSYRATVEFPFSGTVRAVFRGEGSRAPMASNPRKVFVAADVTAALGRRTMRLGRRVRLVGTAEPATHVRVKTQRRVGRRWVRERVKSIPVQDGAFHASIKPRARGSYRIVAQVGSTRRRLYLRVR
ncbi:MAG TPA: peptidoglycan recognition protein [Solirubrobacteraceae bacterium]|nr:peptidoglycan recognition protein [Solirubrobacteraceae bacterium]